MQLKITKENKSIDTISLHPGIYTLGRGKGNDICLTDSSVSRNHARLEISNDFQIRVVDLNSSNGTWLNNSRITSEFWPPAGTVLEIGECRLVLQTSDSPPSSHQSLLPEPYPPVSPVFPPNHERQQQQERQVEGTATKEKQTEQKIFWETAKLVGVLLLISPFIAFLGKNILLADATLIEVENKQRIKNQSIWLEKENKAISIELATVSAYIANETYDPALNLLKEVLQKSPGNSQAIELQKKIHEQKSELAKIAQKKQQELVRKQKAQERYNKQKKLELFKQQIEIKIVERDFTGCIETAQKALSLDPASDMAATSIAFCSQSLTSNQSNKEDAIELEKNKLLSRLKKIQKKGAAAVHQKKYEDALGIWSQARRIDPDRIFDISKQIHQDVRKIQKTIAKLVTTNIAKGQEANEKNDHLAAVTFFKTAHSVKPSDKQAKQLYETQIKKNQILAEEFYHEAIAYASLDSLDSATEAINKARLLAQGNDNLLKRIEKSIADIKTR